MKTQKLHLPHLKKCVRRSLCMLLVTSSFTLSAQQTISQLGSVIGNPVNYLSGTSKIPNSIDVISLSSTRIITSARTTGKYELTAWDVSSSSITKKGSKSVTSAIDRVKSSTLSTTRFVNAFSRNGFLSIEVWDNSADGSTFTLKDTKDGTQLISSGTGFALFPLSSTRFISIAINSDQHAETITWEVNASGALTKKATGLFGSEVRGPVTAIALSSTQFIMTYSLSGSTPVRVILCSVDANGAVSFNDSESFWYHAYGIRLAPLTANTFVFASTDESDENLDNVFSWKVSASNTIDILKSTHSVVANEGVIAKLNSTNVLSAGIKNDNNSLHLHHLAVANDGSFTRKGEKFLEVCNQIKITTLSGNANTARSVTALINSDGKLKLIAWDVTLNAARSENTTGIENTELAAGDMDVYPNPAGSSATFRFHMTESAMIHLKIYNSLGAVVKEVTNSTFNQGTHQVECTTENIPAGIYYCSFETGDTQLMKKLIIVH